MGFIAIIFILGGLFYYFMQKAPNPKGSTDNTNTKNRYKGASQAEQTKDHRHSSYGKWIGGGLGWALGGPIGALLGFAIGSMMTGSKNNMPSQTQSGDFNLSLLVLSAAVMKSDGSVKKSELEYVKLFFRQNYSVEKTKQMMQILRDLLDKNIALHDICRQIQQYMDYHSRLQLIHYLFGIAMADNHLHENEIDSIDAIANYVGIQGTDYKSIKAMFVKDTKSIYNILEVSPQASDEDIKKAYKKMAIKYHPDKVSHLGEEVRQAAEDKFQELQAAYEEIKKQRGIK